MLFSGMLPNINLKIKTMKKQFTLSKKMITKLIVFVSVCFLSMPVLNAQTILPNVKVNTDNYYDVSLDGGKTIAVLNDTIYAIWQGNLIDTTSNIYFTKSIDGGLTFSADLIIFQETDSINHMFPSLAVSQDGNIHIAWTAITNNGADYNVWYTKSIDGGNSFETPIHITTNNASILPNIATYNNYVYIFYVYATNYPMADYYFVRSTNNGDVFDSPIQINDAACTGGIEFEGLTSLALDSSGNIYLAWVDGRRANGNGDIYFAKSTDNGQNFSTNIMVNDINQSGADSIQYIPSIAIGSSNDIYVTFTDKRLGDDWSNNRVYISKSSDGGSTFSTETLLAGHNETCKSHDIIINSNDEINVALNTFANSHWGIWLFVSDDGGNNFSAPVALSDSLDKEYGEVYMAPGNNAEVYTLWTDNREGYRNVYFTKTNFETGNDIIINDDKYVLYPNPTSGNVQLTMSNEQLGSRVEIVDINGVVVKQFPINSAQFTVDLSKQAKGVYFVKLITENGVATQKLILE